MLKRVSPWKALHICEVENFQTISMYNSEYTGDLYKLSHHYLCEQLKIKDDHPLAKHPKYVIDAALSYDAKSCAAKNFNKYFIGFYTFYGKNKIFEYDLFDVNEHLQHFWY